MLFGRMVGRVLLVIALLMASGEAVMAIGLADRHPGISTADLLVLLWGRLPQAGSQSLLLWDWLLTWPAWTLLGPLGFVLALGCRRRRRRYLFR